MPQLSDDGDLGASDELIQFHEEGERDDKRTGTAAETDLDDVKSSLVNETETTNGASGSEAANRRAGTEPDAPGRARHNRLSGEALRWQQTAGGLFAPSPYVGYPFFVIPDLRRSYLAGGGLAAARAYFPLQWPLLDIPGRSAMRDSATPVHLSSGVHADVGHLHPLLSRRPEGLFPPQRASPGFSPDPGSSRPPHVACYPISPGGGAHAFDWLQGQPVYPMTGGFSPATLGINASVSRKSAAPMVGTQAVDQKVKAHIKKPLNAFMLFMRDERPKVVAQCQVKESATINQILGQRWHSLSKDEQAKYYELARKERLLHSQLYPGWSARDNYGKKKKRKKSKSDPQQDTGADDSPPQPKCAHLSSSVHDEAPHAHAPLMHARAHTSAVDMHTRTRPSRPRTVSHLTHTHLSQASPASSVDSPATPTAALASPAAPAPTHTEHTHSVTQSASYGEHTSPYADRPLALTAKPPRDTHAPRLSAPTLEPPSPAPPSSSHRRANQL
ncbi:transcription factor 7-like 1-B isoform X2 [Phyllopteryx taeniolatus]|uniref:transcription factor 7-like 1-B isoform X2 n=1 Tax=Phyllopteryx taeniolatus TaxID=161469 RepID=UPI002AD40833|nr:transcription factor 7-like 1-B isoform X2 [Phyllopteryx taeniolatus]